MEKYFNDAIVGNKDIVASYTNKGELIRLFYPNVDYRQFINYFYVGVKLNDSGIIYLHNDVNNQYNQYYESDTNILTTEIENSYFKLSVVQTDFIPINENVLIKKYTLKNNNTIDLNVNFVIHSSLITDENNQVSGLYKNNALFQYMHDYTIVICSDSKIANTKINNSEEIIEEGISVEDKDYVGMSNNSSVWYDLSTIKPNEEKELVIYVYIDNNIEEKNLEGKIGEIVKKDVKKELDVTAKYWRKYVKEHTDIKLENKNNQYINKIEQIYKRTVLLYPLLTNQQTGGISAAIEVDENKNKCGRYSFCWPRDGIFITNALDILNMGKETEKFYKVFCKNTQSKDGRWEQRFYTDGRLAPCWGYQIDETASIVYGVYNHYENTKNMKFLKDTLPMCEKAVKYLKKYIQKILDGEDERYLSYDIWEENEGIHTYSLASIFAGFNAMIKIYESIADEFKENRLKIEKIEKEKLELNKYLLEIKEYILKYLYDEHKNTFIRNKDGKIDISILGLVTPFQMFTPNDKRILNTIEKIDLTLRTYTGGYLRYENDTYVGGNPWVIANLWMANYYLEQNSRKKAKEAFDFAVKASTKHGFLPEQVDNDNLNAKWVIGLGWSHAMFVIVLKKLNDLGII